MLSFLHRASATFRALASRPLGSTNGVPLLRLVVGNEAADADSILSAIAEAAILGDHAVPVASCRAVDWALRREPAVLLQEATTTFSSGASPSSSSLSDSLIFIDDVWANLKALEALAEKGQLKIRLTDHNVPWGPFKESAILCGAIDSIVDHHRDGGQLLARIPVGSPEREISFNEAEGRGVGSACTLVARHLQSASGLDETLRRELAYCLMGVILLDTIGMNETAGKTTPTDIDMVDYLSKHVLEGRYFATAEDRKAMFDRLSRLRMDPSWWLSLPLHQALLYDYKCFSYEVPSSGTVVRVGISALTLHAADFLTGESKETAETASAVGSGIVNKPVEGSLTPLHLDPSRLASLRSFLTSAGDAGVAGKADVFIIMSYCAGRRQFAVWRHPVSTSTVTAGFIDRLTSLLAESPLLQPFKLPLEASSGDADISVFEQTNTKASRKQVEPLLATLLVEAARD